MDNSVGITILSSILSLVLGGVGVVAFKKFRDNKRINSAKSEADKILSRAKQEAQKIEQRAKENENRIRKNAETDIQKQKQNLTRAEQSYKEKENGLDARYREKEKNLEERDRVNKAQAEKIQVAEHRLKEHEHKMNHLTDELKTKLAQVSNYTIEQAKSELVEAIRKDAEVDAAKKIQVIETEAKTEAESRAKRLISMAIARYAGEYSAERTVSVVALPNDEMKGRIIGREGRNIRALEAACGVDLIVDDTPEAVVISGFDPVRREVARRALERLMEDGRVHPGRIEEVIHKIKSELFKSIKEDGEKACYELGLIGVNQEVIKLIGSLKYRTSFTQNNYTHSIEVGFLCGMMAGELGVDVKTARRAGLMHDIGKALDHSIEGSHAVIGADFAKKHGENETVCHAIRAHHEDEQPRSVYAFLTTAGDALSGARPGARRHMMEAYVKRLEDLESIGNSFDGVLRTFAVQAGREIRVMVEGSKVNDEQSLILSRDIARKIERELNYPGQIKVTVIRETRAIEMAR